MLGLMYAHGCIRRRQNRRLSTLERARSNSYSGWGSAELPLTTSSQVSCWMLVGRIIVNTRIVISFMVAAFATLAPGRAVAQSSADAYAKQGDQDVRVGNCPAAIEAYQKAIALDPKRGLVYYGLALCYHQQQRWQLAIDNWKQARGLLEPEGAMLLVMGADYYHLKQYNDALKTFQAVIPLQTPDLDQAMAKYWMGVVYNAMGQPENAEHALWQAINLKDDDADFYFELGDALFDLKQYKDAAESYKDAIHLRADFADAYYQLGFVYLAMHNQSEANAAYNKLQTLDKEKADALHAKIVAGTPQPATKARGSD